MGKLLTLNDLAERWGLSPATADKIVRARKVPFLSLRSTGPGGDRGPKSIRFRAESVEAWERDQETLHDADDSSNVPTSSPDVDAYAHGWDGVER